MSLKLTQEISREIDKETGEILKQTLTQTVQDVNYDQEPEFIKIYLHTLTLLHGLDGVQGKIMLAIASRMSYATKKQVIIINSYVKEEIMEEVNCSKSHISNTITLLVKKGLLFRQGKSRSGAYIVNPIYIAKGKWKEVKELQLNLVFNKNKTCLNAVEVTDNNEQIRFSDIPLLPTTPAKETLPLKSKKTSDNLAKEIYIKKTTSTLDAIKDQISLIEPTKYYCEYCKTELKLTTAKDKYYCPLWRQKDKYTDQKKCKGTFLLPTGEKILKKNKKYTKKKTAES